MAELFEGLVIAHLGQGIAVEYDDKIILCQTLRKLETVAVGDKVLWSLASPEQGRIEEILPRRSVLARPSRNSKARPVAVNLDTIFVVFAVEPHCDFLLIDQYLVICENNNIDAALVLNKTDLPQTDIIEKELLDYINLGYPLFRVSARTATGLDELKATLKDQVSMLAGRTLTVTAKGGKVTVMINGAAAKVGKNKMPVGNDLVIIEFGSKVIYSKVFSVK